MRKRHGCHLAGRTITFTWYVAHQSGRLARLISVPSRICIVASLIYYTMSASCVVAATQASRAWNNQTEASYSHPAEQKLARAKTVLKSGSRPQAEYTIVSVSEVEDRDRERPDCVVSDVDERDAPLDSTLPQPALGHLQLPEDASKTAARNARVALPPEHARLHREAQAECAVLGNSSTPELTLRRVLAAFSKRTLPFCDRYVLAHVVTAACVRHSCESCIFAALELDAFAANGYRSFVRALHNFDGVLWPTTRLTTAARSAFEPQLVLGDECLILYKDWLCASLLPLYFEYEQDYESQPMSQPQPQSASPTTFDANANAHKDALRVLPCVEVCRQVEEKCPFFLPERDDGSGDPAFVCGPLVESNRFGVYSLDACYVPSCHLEALRTAYAQRRPGCSISNVNSEQPSERNASALSPPVSTARCTPLTREVGNDSRAELDLNNLQWREESAERGAPNDSDSTGRSQLELVRARLVPLPSGSPRCTDAHWLITAVTLLTSCSISLHNGGWWAPGAR